MEREITFRAWDGKKMFHHNWRDKKDQVHDLWQFVVSLPNDCILMQFTGLKDKNGKEIYEADIVEIFCTDETSNQYGQSQGLHEVRFEYGFFGAMWDVEMSNNKVCSPLYIELNKDVFIRGNIYENPELLKL